MYGTLGDYRKNPTRRRWRDANLMDLAAPEMRALIDLRHKPRIDLHHYYYTPAERVPPSIEGADLQTLRGATPGGRGPRPAARSPTACASLSGAVIKGLIRRDSPRQSASCTTNS